MGPFVSHSLVTNSCPTLSWPHGLHSLPGSSVHGISPAKILEWVAIPFSLGSSLPRDRTQVSCIGRRILHHWATREAPGGTFGRFLSSEGGAFMNGISALKNKNPSFSKLVSPLDWVGTPDEVCLQSIQLCCHPDHGLTACRTVRNKLLLFVSFPGGAGGREPACQCRRCRRRRVHARCCSVFVMAAGTD